MISNYVADVAVKNVYNHARAKRERRYNNGISICRKLGCTRIDDGKCLGWDDPLYMWERYGECPYFSDDVNLIKKIEEACKNYQEYMDGKSRTLKTVATIK